MKWDTPDSHLNPIENIGVLLRRRVEARTQRAERTLGKDGLALRDSKEVMEVAIIR